MFHRWPGLLALLALLSLFPAWAMAQDNPAYQSAYDRGDQAFKEGRFDVCAEEFRQAFNIEPRGNLLYNIGFCYEKANDLANALAFYQRFVDAVPNSPKRPAVQRHIAELQEQVADQFQEVSVTSDPTGAMVYIDDKSKGAMGATPLTFKLLPGNYVVIAEFQGYEPGKKKLELKKGASAQVDINLVSSSQVGTVTLMITERDADVLIDNRKVGKSPLQEPLRLKQGKHDLMVSKNGFGTYNQPIEVTPGKAQTVKVELSSGSEGAEPVAAGGGGGGGGAPLFTGPRLLPTITMGVGLATVAGGVVTALSANRLYGQLEDKKKKGEPIASQDVDTGNSRVMLTNVLWGAGGALVAGGAVWWFLAGQSPSASGDIGLSVTPDGSAQVWGSF